MKRLLLLSFLGYLAGLGMLFSQDQPVSPSFTTTGVFLGETLPLRDLPPMTTQQLQQMQIKAEQKVLNPTLKERHYPYASTALPNGPDPVWQDYMGQTGNSRSIGLNIAGERSPYYPSDANGSAGPNHYMQTINTVYTIYDKTTGQKVAGPTPLNLLFSGVTGSNYNDGDPICLYDEQADRWLVAEFSISGTNDYMLIAVSTTNDPTGTWYKYSFDVADMPDYEKFGIWQDGYYMGTNTGGGADIYVFERSQMLVGGVPQGVGFDNPWRPTTIDGFHCVPPVDNDGAFAPAGAPGLFITINDDGVGGGSDELWIMELDVDWANTANSTFTRVQQLAVPSFDSNFGSNWDNIAQPGTTRELDAIPMVIMNVPQYRNFGSYQTLVCCHTVDVDGTDHAGIRWYELRKTSGSWTVRQSGTYAPDQHSRWMGSVMLNGFGEIGLGYSISSSTVYPGIRYCGQSQAAYAAGNGIMDVAEGVIIEATTSQSVANRWGDYTSLCVDPSDDHTFWYTNQYGGYRDTRIASFEFTPPALTAQFSGSPTTVCEGGSVSFTDQSVGSPTSWSWVFQGGTPSTSSDQNPVINYSTAGTYDVTLIVGDGSTNDSEIKTGYITVTGVTADFSGAPTTLTVGGSVNFTDLSTCGPDSWSWSFPGGTPGSYSGSTPPPIYYDTPGSYDVSLTVTKGADADTKTIPAYITVNDISYCDAYGDASYEWISLVNVNGLANPSGSSGSSGYQDFTNITFNLDPGNTYNITLSPGFAGRSKSEYWQVWIDFNNDGDFYDANEEVFNASRERSTVYGTITIPSNAGSTTRMRVRMSRNGLGDPCGSVGLGEVEDYLVAITSQVPDPPVAAFSGNPTSLLAGGTVQFTDLSTNTPDSWLWTFEGGTPATSTAQNPVVTYSSAGTFDVTLEVSNGGGSDSEIKLDYITVTVPPPPVAAFSGNPRTIDQGQGVQFTDLSTANPTSWSWTFEGGTPASSNLQNPYVTYSVPGTYDVTLIATNASGSDTKTELDYITVNSVPAPVANFTSDRTNIYEGESVQFTDLSTGSPTSWSWTFPGGSPAGSTQQNPLVTYYTAGMYDVTLVATNAGGSSQKNEFLYINVTTPPPPPNCANVVTPASGATGVPITTNLQWSPVANASGYIIYFGTDNPPTNMENGTDLGNVTSYNPPGDLNYSAAYNWKIVPYNTYGQASGCAVWSFSTEASPFGSVQISFTDFENGWDVWTDGGGDCYLYMGGTFAWSGLNSVSINDNSGYKSSFYLTNGVDVHTPGYVQIDVEFKFISDGLENNEDFWVQYYNGSSWSNVATYALGQQFNNNIFYAAGVSILESAYNFPTNMLIRFMCDASDNGDQVFIDDVEITASTQVNPNNYLTPLNAPIGPVAGNGAESIVVYPNPAQDEINIDILESTEAEVYINDMQGRVVHHSKFNVNHKEIDLQELSSGIYTILVITPDHFIRTKFIKK